MHATLPKPSIYSFADYRVYLRAYYEYKKSSDYGFSHRVFSKKAGVRTSNYLLLVIQGSRNLSDAMAARFAKACSLREGEAEFFCALVRYNQSKEFEERDRHFRHLCRFRPFRGQRHVQQATASYWSEWFLPPLREMVRVRGFREDPKWIARQFEPRLRIAEVKKGIDTLVQLGLLTRDADGRLHQCEALVSSGPGPLGHPVLAYHHRMLELAAHAIGHVPREHREVSTVTLCVSQDKLLVLKQRIVEFRKELLQLAELDDEPERVVQLNFQLFPLTALPTLRDAVLPSDSANTIANATANTNSPPRRSKRTQGKTHVH